MKLTAYEVMQYIDRNAMLVFTAIAILFSGVMVFGYAVFDEIAIEALAITLLFAGMLKIVRRSNPSDKDTGVVGFHKKIFLVFAAYGILQSIHGLFALPDIRVLRFVLMFLVLLIISWQWSTVRFNKIDVCYITVVSTIIYLIVYISIGMIAETGFHLSRFDLQGEYWSGTSVALFPIFILVLAMSELDGNRKSGLLFWFGYFLIVFATFYYQSRTATILLALFILFGIMTISQRLVTFLIFLFFIIFFPWDSPPPLTPKVIARSIQINAEHMNAELIANKIERTWTNIFGGADTKYAQAPRLIYHTKNDLAGFHANPIPKHDESTQDIDRKIAISAAWCTASHAENAEFLLGSGYWTHRYKMINCIKLEAGKHHYNFPAVYNNIVRTATANGMLVDEGLVGCILLLLLFISTLLSLIKETGLSYRSILPLCVLGMMFLTLFVSLNYDLMLFYLMLMPGGSLLLLYRNDMIRERNVS